MLGCHTMNLDVIKKNMRNVSYAIGIGSQVLKCNTQAIQFKMWSIKHDIGILMVFEIIFQS